LALKLSKNIFRYKVMKKQLALLRLIEAAAKINFWGN